MDIPVTRFRASCLELVRRVESSGEPVDIKRRGRVVARACVPSGSRRATPPRVGTAARFGRAARGWQAQMLHAKGRLTLDRAFDVWIREAAAASVLDVLALDVDVVIALAHLPATFHGDPADRLIAATARAHRIPLATHDRAIRRSRVVRLWKPR